MTHPYISGPGNITQMVSLLRKNFPATVTSETVKKLGLASNNESYVINALQFVGLIDAEGKRTAKGQEVLAIHNEQDFQKSFSALVKSAYADLFEIRGDGAWAMGRDDLIGYFRQADKTSDVIGGRQASVFQAFRSLAGHEAENVSTKATNSKPQVRSVKPKIEKPKVRSMKLESGKVDLGNSKKDIGLTVRIEINLPAEGSAETYDHIFKSIKANLLG
ncbi:MAG: DUF5343 domain-containing protein [Alphaproteobacteria bacterium]|nr:DUF5343 domain-containing protein [Alphaproteobacteria bacterium]